MNILKPDHEKFYTQYKKLPVILSFVIAGLIFIWSIVDVSVFKTTSYSKYYGDTSTYGVMGLESAFLALIVWWIIGAVLFFATWFFSSLLVSATVVRTDAVLEIKEHLKNN